MTVQFPKEREEFPKDNACKSGGINSGQKSQNDNLKMRKEKALVLEKAVTCKPNNSLVGINCGTTNGKV